MCVCVHARTSVCSCVGEPSAKDYVSILLMKSPDKDSSVASVHSLGGDPAGGRSGPEQRPEARPPGEEETRCSQIQPDSH